VDVFHGVFDERAEAGLTAVATSRPITTTPTNLGGINPPLHKRE
jgi:hypothetical protein